MRKVKKIAFIPGAFRPFGDHHMKMVRHYADMCDEVVIVVSNPKSEDSKRVTSRGRDITAQQAKAIIDLCLADSDVKNARSEISTTESPIGTMLRDISRLDDCEVVLGVGGKDDDASRYDDLDLDRFRDRNVVIMPPRETVFPTEGDGVSASDMRSHIDDRHMLKSYLPLCIEDATFQKIYDILNGEQEEKVPTHDELMQGASIFESLASESYDCNTLESACAAFTDGVKREFPDSRLDWTDVHTLRFPILQMNGSSYHLSTTRDFSDRFRVYDSDGKEMCRCEYPSTRAEMEDRGREFARRLRPHETPIGLDDDDEDEVPDEESTQFSNIRLDDATLAECRCGIAAYNMPAKAGVPAYTPKDNPDKAVDLKYDYPDGSQVEIYLDTETGEWDSRVNGAEGKLTPDQMGEFFRSDACRRLDGRLHELWPEEDPYFRDLLAAVDLKKVNPDPCGMVAEDSNVFRKGNIDSEKSRERNAAGRQERTRSGRKLISPSDFDVKHDENERYFVWPKKGREFKWSQWADWNKIRPVARIRFKMGLWVYGVSFSPFIEDDENRGAKAYNLDLEPKLQYLTPEETSEIMELSIMRKFTRHAVKRIVKYISMSDEEIFQRIGRPDKVTIDDIRKTKHVVKNTLKALRDNRADTYIYT